MPVLTKLFVKYYTILYPSICHIAFPREPQFLEKGFFCKREKKTCIISLTLRYNFVTLSYTFLSTMKLVCDLFAFYSKI